MKSLTLIRHAKSSWGDPGAEDITRPLNARGLKNIVQVGGWLGRESFRPDKILSSPAVRARSTAEGIAQAIGFPVERITVVDEIYEARPESLYEIVRRLGQDSESLVLFGHNPGFEVLANDLLYKDEIDRLVTLGVVRMRLLIDSWQEIGPDVAELVSYIYPKMLEGDGATG